MANIEDLINEFHNKIHGTTALAATVDNMIEGVIMLVINNEGGPDPFIVAFCYEIEALKQYQQHLKEKLMDFFEADKDNTSFQLCLFEFLSVGRIRTEEELTEAAEKFKWFNKEEERVMEIQRELIAIFQEKTSVQKPFLIDDFNLGPLGRENFDVRELLGMEGKWSLEDTMIKMYRSSPDKAQSEDQVFSLFQPTGSLIFQSEEYKSNKERLNGLLMRMNDIDKIDDKDKHEATVLMMDQLYQIERVIAYLMHHIELVAEEKIAIPTLVTFTQNLKRLQEERKGRVLVAVHWGVALLKYGREHEVVEEGADDYEIENLFENIDPGQFKNIIRAVYKVFLQLLPVLNASILLTSDRLKKKVLLASSRILLNSEMQLMELIQPGN